MIIFEVETPEPIPATKEAIEIIYNLVSGTAADYRGRMFRMKPRRNSVGSTRPIKSQNLDWNLGCKNVRAQPAR